MTHIAQLMVISLQSFQVLRKYDIYDINLFSLGSNLIQGKE